MQNLRFDEEQSEQPQIVDAASHEQESEKENLPPPALKHALKNGTSLFRGRSKQVKVEANQVLFKGLAFYLEIQNNGEPANHFFEKAVVDHGGKISRRLGKHVTHLVWSEGRTRTLKKALELEDIHIISTLWF